MGINSKQRWLAYKEVVDESQDKALEIFATKRVDVRSTPPMHQDKLSQPILTQQEVRQTLSPPRMNLEELSQPSLTQQEVNQTLSPPRMNQEENMNDVYEDEENDVDLYDNNVGDLEAYNVQENMDQSIPYSRCYAFDSDDDGPDEEVDEDGFTSKEVEVFKKVMGWYPRTPLFEDLTLADEAVVDGGKTIVGRWMVKMQTQTTGNLPPSSSPIGFPTPYLRCPQ